MPPPPAPRPRPPSARTKFFWNAFVADGSLPGADDARMPRAVNDEQPVLAFVFDLGKVRSAPVMRQVIVAYDEIYAIKYFGRKLLPYWRRNGVTVQQMLEKAARDYPESGPALRGV